MSAIGIFHQSRFGSQQFRFIHALDCKPQECNRISLSLHLAAIRPSLGFFYQVFPLWIRCFGPLTGDPLRTRLTVNNGVQDAAQIQNQIRLIMATRGGCRSAVSAR